MEYKNSFKNIYTYKYNLAQYLNMLALAIILEL